MTDTITAPWTSEQVAALEAFQTASGMRPFTCGADQHSLPPRLVPSHSGWYCPDPACDYRQDWAHAFMADPAAWSGKAWDAARRPRSDIGTEFIQQADNPDGVAVAAFESDLAAAGESAAHRRRALAFNAIGPALAKHDRHLPLSVRQEIADAVLAAIDNPH
ncbi:hypothetical protein [Streptomyces microflavus]|uniref:hypothetical protein n=1 Tax=Streptomyces microflavus TaxID=1919 RepID=UPI002E3783DE|nr:hypothetical protein [Streptomyces microflavus]